MRRAISSLLSQTIIIILPLVAQADVTAVFGPGKSLEGDGGYLFGGIEVWRPTHEAGHSRGWGVHVQHNFKNAFEGLEEHAIPTFSLGWEWALNPKAKENRDVPIFVGMQTGVGVYIGGNAGDVLGADYTFRQHPYIRIGRFQIGYTHYSNFGTGTRNPGLDGWDISARWVGAVTR